MTGVIRGSLAGIAVVFAALFNAAALSDTAQLPRWTLEPDSSKLEFVFTQQGKAEQGEFKSFKAVFWFDPDNLQASHFEVSIDMAAIDTGASERDQILKSADLFAVEQWPTATFKAFNFRSRGGDQYLADAELTIRNHSQRLSFPFKLDLIRGGKAFHLQSEVYISRIEYGVGQGDWAGTGLIADRVGVIADVVASR